MNKLRDDTCDEFMFVFFMLMDGKIKIENFTQMACFYNPKQICFHPLFFFPQVSSRRQLVYGRIFLDYNDAFNLNSKFVWIVMISYQTH